MRCTDSDWRKTTARHSLKGELALVSPERSGPRKMERAKLKSSFLLPFLLHIPLLHSTSPLLHFFLPSCCTFFFLFLLSPFPSYSFALFLHLLFLSLHSYLFLPPFLTVLDLFSSFFLKVKEQLQNREKNTCGITCNLCIF